MTMFRPSVSDSQVNSQYEEIVSHVNCPTCRGSGKIPRDSREEYIALIPWSDKRLQPPRTMLKVCLAIIISMLVCAILLFFLLPRTVGLSSNEFLIKPYYASVDGEDAVDINMIVPFNVTNNNFVPIYITKLTTQVRISQTILAEITQDGLNSYVPMRTVQEVNANVNISVRGTDFRGLAYECRQEWSYFHDVDMQFTITLTATMLGHAVEASLATRQYVNCYPTVQTTTQTPTTISTSTSSSALLL